ncbi:hypothetical protein EU537_12745 [Candidatus Thorarchaeota archaeon]|nr:MAG: hypothetical protein EU537_12745 [Candidatus Thorarchaeota archaeon]
MRKKEKGAILLGLGAVIFLASIILILPIAEYYVLSLILMFVGIILLGIGGAIVKGYDQSLDSEREMCYYCNGTGKAEESGEEIICPRCGGTGIAPEGSSS